MKQHKFSTSSRLRSFKYAFNGLRILFIEEHNARIHLLAALAAIAVAILFNVNIYEWMAILFSIGLVFISEIFNTAIENISDFISPGKHEKIKRIKDLSAAAVLISAITAGTIGLLIFLPKVIGLVAHY